MSDKTAMNQANFYAIAVGSGIGLIAVLLQHYQNRQERNRLKRELSRLNRDVKEVKKELSEIKTTKLAANDGVDGGTRRRRSRRDTCLSRSSRSESSMYTAISDEDEFYDISSDEDGLVLNPVEKDDTEMFFNKIDEMMKTENVLEILLSCSSDLCSNANYLWRLAKAYKIEFEKTEEKGAKLKFLEIGLQHASKAVDLEERNGNAHKWLAILLGLKSDFLPIAEKLENGFLFQKHLNLALEQLPHDFSLYHLLARFKFAIANLTWFERSAAKMIGKLPDVTMDDAIVDARRAEELNPDAMPENRLLLAKAYFANNDTQSGLHWLHKTEEIVKQTNPIYNEVTQLLVKYE